MTDFAPKSISFLLIWIKPVPELRTSSMSITCLSLNSDGLNFRLKILSTLRTPLSSARSDSIWMAL